MTLLHLLTLYEFIYPMAVIKSRHFFQQQLKQLPFGLCVSAPSSSAYWVY